MSRLPPITSNARQACYVCFKDEDVSLQKCSGCRRVSYCSTTCQTSQWRYHKKFCRAYSTLESDVTSRTALIDSIPTQPTDDAIFIAKHCDAQASDKLQFISLHLQRALDVAERNLIGNEPRCLGCTRTDQDLRLQAPAETKPLSLSPCSDCKLSFFCSDGCREFASHKHDSVACRDGHDGFTHCALNQELVDDVRFTSVMDGAKSGPFHWAPERTVDAWESLEGKNWFGEFAARIAQDFRLSVEALAAPFVRGASEGLSMPLTILYGLEKLSKDDSWSRAETLRIHIMGAHVKEVEHGMIFEELLHRLPDVKTIEITLCGPQMSEVGSPEDLAKMSLLGSCCPDCKSKGRNRLQPISCLTYHEYIKLQGSKFKVPHLAVAFNSGMSDEVPESWEPTLKCLVEKKIPTLFTAYNKDEATNEAEMLVKAGASLLPTLKAVKNPWGSIQLHQEPNRVSGFYACNAWIAGGFK